MITDEEAARLRSQVPDDPIPRPAATIPCECCGVAVPDPDPPLKDNNQRLAMGLGAYWEHPYQGRYGLCDSCKALREQAEEYLREHPLLVRQVGPHTALDRIESVLWAHAILGRSVEMDLGLLVPRLASAAHSLGYRTPTASNSQGCNARPWDHVGMSQRANLRAAYAQALADAVMPKPPAPPVPIPCPTIACGYCGVPSLHVPAAAVEKYGMDTVVGRVWRSVEAPEEALGGPVRPHPIRCHVCPACADAIDGASIGWTSRGRAVLAHVERISKERADRLRVLLAQDYPPPPPLPAWRALPPPRVPNDQPWAHLRLERL
ncbi:hypothetical protein [Nocardioides sp. HB32]